MAIVFVDTKGLGIPPLRGHTLVQYAGSLVGRDFRGILQVAPQVLQGLLPDEAYEAWLALCRLAPLIFQPKIEDRGTYMRHLREGIDDFLAATALWSTQWFNKPKFHLFLHLPLHIERFGPPLLYATEGFESYNFLIRLRSIHSNRHAPSSDIGEAFSFLHAVRHLVSGGFVDVEDSKTHVRTHRQAGEGVRVLIHDAVFRHLMGMDGILNMENTDRAPLLRKDPRVQWRETRSAGVGYTVAGVMPETSMLQSVGVYLSNGDLLRQGGYALYQRSDRVHCGRVEEILVHPDTFAVRLLLAHATIGGVAAAPYRFPTVQHSGTFALMAAKART
ncbi:hypothetical protein ONZ51_g2656 [Trametes cubensis]|uniref:Uncharacterized protein n=1 Tax=Trametes cubensis TaxID=1111947 RepID=A0AAD7U1M9_9APHY|nr:hypothetical protein ONZ51_g2656 [Trametes cubensis]